MLRLCLIVGFFTILSASIFAQLTVAPPASQPASPPATSPSGPDPKESLRAYQRAMSSGDAKAMSECVFVSDVMTKSGVDTFHENIGARVRLQKALTKVFGESGGDIDSGLSKRAEEENLKDIEAAAVSIRGEEATLSAGQRVWRMVLVGQTWKLSLHGVGADAIPRETRIVMKATTTVVNGLTADVEAKKIRTVAEVKARFGFFPAVINGLASDLRDKKFTYATDDDVVREFQKRLDRSASASAASTQP